MAWHDSGTVSVTSGSSTVTGVGTDWLAGLRPGDALFLPDGWPYEVLNIASDTMLQLTRPYAGPTKSGERYTQLPSQGYIKLSADQLAAIARQIGGIPTRVESLEGSQLSKGLNLFDLENAEAARQNLGLKGLATLALSDLGEAATRNVGRSSGELMEVGAFGLGGSAEGSIGGGNPLVPCGFGYDSAVGFFINCRYMENVAGFRISNAPYTRNFYLEYANHHSAPQDAFAARALIRHSSNTTVDGNGFIKAASPIIDLYADSIAIKEGYLETRGVFLVVVDVGHYQLHNCPPVADGSGWYLEQPRDRNNNLYHTCDWVYDDVARVLTIKTYVPDYSSGRAENGAPVDIQEGRFISLRFQEDPSLYPELEPEPEPEPDERSEFEEPAA